MRPSPTPVTGGEGRDWDWGGYDGDWSMYGWDWSGRGWKWGGTGGDITGARLGGGDGRCRLIEGGAWGI